MTEPAGFREVVDVGYWATCHEDYELTPEQNEATAVLYVDPVTGICGCCGADYRNTFTRPWLDELHEKHPHDVLIRTFARRPAPAGFVIAPPPLPQDMDEHCPWL